MYIIDDKDGQLIDVHQIFDHLQFLPVHYFCQKLHSVIIYLKNGSKNF